MSLINADGGDLACPASPFPSFVMVAPADEVGTPEADGAVIHGPALLHLQQMGDHYAGLSRKFQICAQTTMGAQDMAYRCAFMAAQAMVRICTILSENADILTPEARDTRMVGKAAGQRCKAILDLFEALAPKAAVADRVAEAFVSVVKVNLTDIFDDVLQP